jgi:hypothetical protein
MLGESAVETVRRAQPCIMGKGEDEKGRKKMDVKEEYTL